MIIPYDARAAQVSAARGGGYRRAATMASDRHARRTVGQWALAALAAALTLASTASAAAARPESLYAPRALVLTVAQGEEPEPVARAVTLQCTPRGGTHPAAAHACATLEPVGGDVTALTPADTFCTLQYEPYTVTARGVWDGRLLDVRATYGNRCALAAATGPVFAF